MKRLFAICLAASALASAGETEVDAVVRFANEDRIEGTIESLFKLYPGFCIGIEVGGAFDQQINHLLAFLFFEIIVSQMCFESLVGPGDQPFAVLMTGHEAVQSHENGEANFPIAVLIANLLLSYGNGVLRIFDLRKVLGRNLNAKLLSEIARELLLPEVVGQNDFQWTEVGTTEHFLGPLGQETHKSIAIECVLIG